MEIIRELILKKRTEGISTRRIAEEYDINEATLRDWLYFWRYGVRRKKTIPKRQNKGKKEKYQKYRREWSKEAKEARKIMTKKYFKDITFIKQEDSEEDKRNIRYISGSM